MGLCKASARSHDVLSLQNFHREAPVRFGSVTVGDGTVQAVPVFGSGGSSAKRVFCVSVEFNPREASTLIFKIRSCAVRSDL